MNNSEHNSKPWGGRFSESTDEFVEAFTASVDFDRRLYRYDIAGSIAHARRHCRGDWRKSGPK
jgi:argininosuccinate lyase